MQMRKIMSQSPAAPGQAFGEPHELADGTTVIPTVNPVGVFVVKDGRVSWQPAVDKTRLALCGVLTGLVAALLFGIAAIRRPPWPDVHITLEDRRHRR